MITATRWQQALSPYLPQAWMRELAGLDEQTQAQLQEIRLRSGAPVMLTVKGRSRLLRDQPPLICSQDDLEALFLAACDYSPSSRSEQIRRGYLLLRGGFRMGLSGRCLQAGEGIRAIHPVTAANIRILREIHGAARHVLPQIRRPGGIYNTLIMAPPGGGKTTLLRDMIRMLSDGLDGKEGMRMGVVDERGELAGSVMGVPTLDIGRQSDVLDGCSKAEGMRLMIRSMAPQVIAVDELGGMEDGAALAEAARCGVSVIATAHGAGMADLQRPQLRPLAEQGVFQRVVLLGAVPGGAAAVERLETRP